MAFVDNLQSIRDNLVAELKGETARRAALVLAGNPAPATYQSGNRQVSWNEYLQMMLKNVLDANKAVIAAGGDGGLIEEYIRGYS